jgi:hypothetical protein
MPSPLFHRNGTEIGQLEGDRILLNDSTEWRIEEGNVYASDDDFIGHVRDDFIFSMDGEVLYTVNKPYSGPEE